MSLDLDLVTGKNVTVWAVPGVTAGMTITAGVPAVTVSGGTPAAVSTLGILRLNNRTEQKIQQASNLRGGVARPPGIRMLNGYILAWGDTPPVFPNDLFGVNFTLDGSSTSGHCATNPCVRCTAIEIVAEAYSEDKKNKVYYIIHFAGAGFDFATFAATGVDPDIDPIQDDTQPVELPSKGLGMGIGPAGSLYTSASKTLMYWTTGVAGQVVPYCAGMRLKIEALADPDWNSSLNGIAYTPRGDIDWTLKLTQRVNKWSIPSDTLIGDLDGTHSLLMATRLNSDLSFATGWGLEFGGLNSKEGEYDHASRKVISTDYVFQKDILQSGGSTKYGSIVDPSGTTKWGTLGS